MSLKLCELVNRYEESNGEGVSVVIVDSGVESSHPDLDGTEISGVIIEERFERIVKKDYDGIDVAGHGTACAGLVLRMAPKAKIVSCRILNRSIESTSRALLEAFHWITQQLEIGVVNLSLGTPNKEFGLEIARYVDLLYSRGIPVVAARGYEDQPDYPSAFGSPVSVTAEPFDDENRLSYRPGDVVEFGAKGYALDVPWIGGKRSRVDGSSFAAPLVAGRIARWKSLNKELKVWEIKTLLVHQAKEIPLPDLSSPQ